MVIDGKAISLAVSWILWCFLHSAFLDPSVSDRIRKAMGAKGRYYKAVYSLVSFVTLLPVWIIHRWAEGPDLIRWAGLWFLAKLILWMIIAYLLYKCSKLYDWGLIVGLRQLRDDPGAGAPDPPLVMDGLLSIVRHPVYITCIIMLWSRDMSAADILTNVILSVYFVAGAFHEETLLLKRYGRLYRDYQKKVPMFLPCPVGREKMQPIFKKLSLLFGL